VTTRSAAIQNSDCPAFFFAMNMKYRHPIKLIIQIIPGYFDSLLCETGVDEIAVAGAIRKGSDKVGTGNLS
jgi:hypothetical protein